VLLTSGHGLRKKSANLRPTFFTGLGTEIVHDGVEERETQRGFERVRFRLGLHAEVRQGRRGVGLPGPLRGRDSAGEDEK
jgi:hypothetical protein